MTRATAGGSECGALWLAQSEALLALQSDTRSRAPFGSSATVTVQWLRGCFLVRHTLPSS